jgi:parallel beta-helix repeat protein
MHDDAREVNAMMHRLPSLSPGRTGRGPAPFLPPGTAVAPGIHLGLPRERERRPSPPWRGPDPVPAGVSRPAWRGAPKRLVAVALTIWGLLVWPALGRAAVVRFVDGRGVCGGRAPCYSTIQSAVDAARASDTVRIEPGIYTETVRVVRKNDALTAGEAERVTIEADPEAAPGQVVLVGPTGTCPGGEAVRIHQSSFVTIRGLTIVAASGPGIALDGGLRPNAAVHLERNRIVANGRGGCAGGIAIGRGNRETLIANNAIHDNGRDGVVTTDGGGPSYLVNNTIHGNGWNGVRLARRHDAILVNNAITGNGIAPGLAGGRAGVMGDRGPLDRTRVTMLANLVCGNRLGELSGFVLGGEDAGNLTPEGTEGPGVGAAPGCDDPAATYRAVSGPDAVGGTIDDDFGPAPGSALIDRGVDPRGIGLDEGLDQRFEVDLLGVTRPAPGTPSADARFDIGALEHSLPPDTLAPTVTFLRPAAGAVVRGEVTVEAEAVDGGSGVTGLVLEADSRPLPTASSSRSPAPVYRASAVWSTADVPDGAHTLAAVATDRAGISAATTRVVITDNTPPVAEITSGTIGAGDARFTVTGTDNLTPPERLRLAWRVDESPWSPVTAAEVSLVDLAPGPHLFEVTAQDEAGNDSVAPAQRLFTIAAVRMAITDPPADAVIEGGFLLVRGTVDAGGAGGGEVSVLVNGTPTAVHDGSFATLITVSTATTEVSGVATTRSGATARHNVPVTILEPSAPPPFLQASPRSGVAPLAVTILVLGAPPGASIQLDVDGDGSVDRTGTSLDGEVVIYDRPGVYTPTATFTDARGARRVARGVVQVADRTSLDSLLQARWTDLKDALRAADIPGALAHISQGARDRYDEAFRAIVQRLPGIDAILPGLTLEAIGGGMAIYQAARTDGGVPRLFEVRFALGADGFWRIDSF